MGKCIYCGEDCGWFRSYHKECKSKHVLLLLIRYNTISGEVRGYQMALPEQVFSYLKENYHLQHE